jgi:Na+-driven multidrug efflux pump
VSLEFCGVLFVCYLHNVREDLAFWSRLTRNSPSGFLQVSIGMVLTQSFNGAGDTWTPTLINFFIFWLWEIPLAILLALVFDLGPVGVFVAMTVSFSSLAVVSAILFRRGKWKTRMV